MISVLVADDSFLMRNLISDMLKTDPEISVIGTANDGDQVVEKVHALKPDVITMDVQMPRMDGLLAIRQIQAMSGAKPVVIMLSAFTEKDADITLDCLRAGAFDCIQKPSGPRSLNIAAVRDHLCATVKAAASARSGVAGGMQKKTKKTRQKFTTDFPLVIIGASTGGPAVLERIFAHMAGTPLACVVVVQHMPAAFTEAFAARLDSVAPMTVVQAKHGDLLETGVAYVAPGDYHLTLQAEGKNYILQLDQASARNGMRPSIDVFMESAAEAFSGPMLAVLLTGMGNDGKSGMQKMKDAGAITLVQEPSTCVVDSMVQSVLDDGSATEKAAPDAISKRICEFSLT